MGSVCASPREQGRAQAALLADLCEFGVYCCSGGVESTAAPLLSGCSTFRLSVLLLIRMSSGQIGGQEEPRSML